jgi:AraC family transcriptional regulator
MTEEGFTIQLTDAGSQRVICLRHFGPYSEVGETWAQLTVYAFEHGLSGPKTQAIGIVHDDPTTTPANQIRYDACLTVQQDQAGAFALKEGAEDEPIGIRMETVNIGRAVKTVHNGHYGNIKDTYGRVLRATADAPTASAPRREPPYYEFYKTNPRLVPSAKLVTEIYFPVNA